MYQYNIKICIFYIIIVWDNIVKPSPFAIITVDGNQIKTTKTKSNTSNPKWNEQIILYLFMFLFFN